MSATFSKLPSTTMINTWHDSITQNGVSTIKVRRLLGYFGLKARGPDLSAAHRVAAWLEEMHGIYHEGLTDPDTSLDDSARLYDYPVARLGRGAEAETAFCKKYGAEIARRLNCTLITVEECPPGTKDRIDLLCRDQDGTTVIVEVKLNEGRGAVEQILRYVGSIYYAIKKGHRRHYTSKVRGVLITGIEDPGTRRVFESKMIHPPIEWWRYGLGEDDELLMERIV